MAVMASYEYSGMGDYWGGNGRRWDKDAGCLFAYYGRDTTLGDIVDMLCEDYWSGGECDEFPEGVSTDMIREAIMTDMLNELGRADVKSGALAECAINYAACNPLACRECAAGIGEAHEDDCAFIVEWKANGEWGEDADGVVEEDCQEEDDCYESPIFVALIEVDVCPDCGVYVEDSYRNDEGRCDDCAAKVVEVEL